MPADIEILGVTVALDWRFVALIFTAFVGGVIRGFAGFGSALVLVPVLTALYGPRAAVAIEVIIEIPVLVGLLPIAVRHAERATVLPLMAALLLSIPAGALVLKAVDPEIMRVVIAVVVLTMVWVVARQGQIASLLDRRGTLATGVLIGAVQGATGTAGPIAVTTLLARGDPADISRANMIALATVMIGLTILSFWAFGMLTRHVMVIGTLAAPACLIGVGVGNQLFSRYGDAAFRGFILALVAVTALSTLAGTLLQ